MNENLKRLELIELRNQLQNDIHGLLIDFESKTGLSIIDIIPISEKLINGEEQTVYVRVDVKL